jgi:hypothetical protein
MPRSVGWVRAAVLVAIFCHSGPAAAGQPGGDARAPVLPQGEIEIGKERFWLPGHGSARLVLRLRAPEDRLDPARLDAKVRAAAEAFGPVTWVPLAEATHSVRLDLHYIDPRIDRPHGEHIPYVTALLAWTHEPSGGAGSTILVPMMDPFFAYANLLRLPGPGPYRFDLALRPIALPGMQEPGETRRTYRITLP